MSMNDLFDSILDETFEAVLSTLEERARKADFELSLIERELSSLYDYDGLGWAGRGDVKQAEIEGSILAYQALILRYKSNDQ